MNGFRINIFIEESNFEYIENHRMSICCLIFYYNADKYDGLYLENYMKNNMFTCNKSSLTKKDSFSVENKYYSVN
jgi:hypothetical protein